MAKISPGKKRKKKGRSEGLIDVEQGMSCPPAYFGDECGYLSFSRMAPEPVFVSFRVCLAGGGPDQPSRSQVHTLCSPVSRLPFANLTRFYSTACYSLVLYCSVNLVSPARWSGSEFSRFRQMQRLISTSQKRESKANLNQPAAPNATSHGGDSPHSCRLLFTHSSSACPLQTWPRCGALQQLASARDWLRRWLSGPC